MMRRQCEEGSRQSTNLKVISIDVGPQIGAFFLHGCARSVSNDEKGASAEDENIDILRKSIDT